MSDCPCCLRAIDSDALEPSVQASRAGVPVFVICRRCGFLLSVIEPGEVA